MTRNLIIQMFILILLIGSFLFYWYEYRPSKITQECNQSAMKEAQEAYKKRYPWEKEKVEEGWYLTKDYENSYEQCLRERGL